MTQNQLDGLKRQLKGKQKDPWKCTQCGVLNTGDQCQNCSRDKIGAPMNKKFPEDKKDMRPGLRNM